MGICKKDWNRCDIGRFQRQRSLSLTNENKFIIILLNN